MCAIFTSFSKDKLKELHKINAYRGELSYSLASFKASNDNVQLQVLFKDQGKLPEDLIDHMPESDFYVAHIQAPTSETSNIHPAVESRSLLWHNGIVKQSTLTDNQWDTQYILDQVIDYGWSALSRIDGTFACIMYHENNLFAFRNEISPLFIDQNLNISSTNFNLSNPMLPNTIYKLDCYRLALDEIATFSTAENPYFFID